ncbi:nucleotidyltransferase family protein [Schlegelella sp. S2-27]|uniref:Nucleotidyltransferase family protein n=1 Tax=Caldimonas mangrovi TaxID=2944811 RepID=A0ABT0YLR6_9BURK|nr:nucleotidyltransferase family protein [Caldimonas mangrovi]MCM5679673.1 nucleotidyltransferase family protein [Caldimonas mangrovi]
MKSQPNQQEHRMKAVPVVIVLAAGAGTRFAGQSHKLAQSFGHSTVLGTTLAQVVASHLPAVVVTTRALREVAHGWVAAQDVIEVPEAGPGSPQLGMGYSIAAGVRARGDAPGWLVLPGDMPLVKASTLRAVAAALQHHPVAYAQHFGRRGHPVAFSGELFSELATLTGDEGARRIVARYPAAAVEVQDPGVLMDLDTQADLHRLRQAHDAPPAAVQQVSGS